MMIYAPTVEKRISMSSIQSNVIATNARGLMAKKIYIVYNQKNIPGKLLKDIDKIFSTKAKASKYVKSLRKDGDMMSAIAEYELL